MSTTEVNRDDEIIAQVLATYTTPVSKIKCKVYLNEPFNFIFNTGTRITKNKPQPSRISVRNVMLEKWPEPH